MRKRARTLMLMLLIATLSSVAYAQTCDPYYVLSGCEDRVYGGKSNVDLPAAALPPTAITMSSAPELQERGYAFVSHVSSIHAFDYFDSAPEVTIDVGAEIGLAPGEFLFLQDVATGAGVAVSDGATHSMQHALYAVGVRSGASGAHPYFVVLDQQAIIDLSCTGVHSGPVVVGHGYLCDGGGPVCDGIGFSVDVSSPTRDGEDQVVQAAVLEFVPATKQKFVKLTRDDDPAGPWTASVAAGNIESATFNSPVYPYSGMDTNPISGETHGLWGTGMQVTNLDTTADSCALPGAPADLAIHAIDLAENPDRQYGSYQFVAVEDGSSSNLLIFPEGQCPNFSQSSSLSIPIGHEPIGVSLYAKGPNSVRATVVSQDGTISRPIIYIDPTGAQDDLQLISNVGDTATCPTDFAMLPTHLCGCEVVDEDEIFCLKSCPIDEDGHPKCPDPKVKCLDLTDPACIVTLGR